MFVHSFSDFELKRRIHTNRSIYKITIAPDIYTGKLITLGSFSDSSNGIVIASVNVAATVGVKTEDKILFNDESICSERNLAT